MDEENEEQMMDAIRYDTVTDMNADPEKRV